MIRLLLCGAFFLVIGSGEGGYLTRKHAQRLLGVPPREAWELPPDQWFQQKLDHFDPTNPGSWWQRYQTNDTWFRNSKNSPIFLMIGGEGIISAEWMVKGAWMEYAQMFNALCFQLEHRFYGKSQPKDLSVKSLRYLSSEQALADIAYFIDGMNSKYKLAPTNKWVVFGGSYPGSLAAWARLKFPHLIHAAISTSGPVLAELDFKAYDDVVRESLRASSQQCAKNVHQAALQVEDILKKPVLAKKLFERFYLCSPVDLNSKGDVTNFIQSLAGNFQGIVQYNKDNRISSISIPTPTVDDLCAIMTNNSIGDLIDRYVAVNSLVSGDSCIDISYYDGIMELQSVNAPNDARSWTYQTCTEFGFYQTSSSKNELFGSGFKLQYFIDQCKAIFGDDFDSNRVSEGIKRSNIMYGQMKVVDSTTNVMFVQGSLDPWHVLGIYESYNPKSPAILIDGTAHCANMYPSNSNDPQQLVEARTRISAFIEEMLSTNEMP